LTLLKKVTFCAGSFSNSDGVDTRGDDEKRAFARAEEEELL